MSTARTVLLIALVLSAGSSARALPPAETRLADPPDLVTLKAAVDVAPDDAAARRALAIALYSADMVDASIEHFERAVELEPSARHLLDLALVYGALDRLTEAEALYVRLLRVSPNHAIALHNLGNLAMRRDDHTAAIGLYGKALAADPNYMLAHYHLGAALRAAERNREAYKSFEKVLALKPANSAEVRLADEALYELATLDLEMGAVERAALYFGALIEQDPSHPRAHYGYGRALLLLGRDEEAQRHLDIHMQLKAEHPRTGPVATGE